MGSLFQPSTVRQLRQLVIKRLRIRKDKKSCGKTWKNLKIFFQVVSNLRLSVYLLLEFWGVLH